MRFTANFIDGSDFTAPTGKIVCVGRNYAAHAEELNNPLPDSPILFIKPETAAQRFSGEVLIPASDCHYEAELAFLIGERLTKASPAAAAKAVVGVGLALDLTRRQLQAELKAKSLPWETAKSFDGACPLSAFVPRDALPALNELSFSFTIDGMLRQRGLTANMLTQPAELIAYMSHFFTLLPGDIVLSGTPEGVGELKAKQHLQLELADDYRFDAVTTTLPE